MSQGVSETDKINIKKYFGRGQDYTIPDGTANNNYIKQLKAAGFSKVDSLDYDATEYYQTPEDMIFLLKHTPIIPDFGGSAKDFELLEEFIEKYNTPKGIKTNSKRYMIIAEK